MMADKEGSLNTYLDERARAIWPETTSRCSFRPALEEDKTPGAFSTDFCLGLSSELNIAPAAIAERLLEPARPAPEGVSWDRAGDFICVDLSPVCLRENRLRELVSCDRSVPSAVIIPEYLESASPAAYLRTISLAWEHFAVLQSQKTESRLYSGEKSFETIEDFSGYAESIAGLRNGRLMKPEDACALMSSAIDAAAEMHVFIWIASDALPKRLFQKFYHEYIHRKPGRVLRCPDVNWSNSREPLKIPEFMNGADARLLFAFLMYLTSEIPATDLDLSVPNLEEKDNIVWFLSSLLNRIERIGREPSGREACGRCSEGVPSILPRLERFTALYPYFLSRAAVFGEVERLNLVLTKMARLLNIALNDAGVRDGLRGRVDHCGVEVIDKVAGLIHPWVHGII